MAMTNAQLGSGFWIGHKTGNLFRVVGIDGVDGDPTRTLRYQQPGKDTPFEISLQRFAARFHNGSPAEVYKAMLELTPSASNGEGGGADVGLLIEPDHRHTFENMVTHEDCREAIQVGLNRILQAKALEEAWSLSHIEPRGNRCVLNFHGPPGTGKTMCAYTIARELGKKVYQVDYASIISKYVGDTAKHIRAAFEMAKQNGAILFFDEADSLLSRRMDMSGEQQAFQTSINQNRNVLMQELDRFNGIVIMTTNVFANYDEAIVRRIAAHIPFALPSLDMRETILRNHVTNHDRVEEGLNWTTVALDCKGLSGGDILNVVINAINLASLEGEPETWELTLDVFLTEVARVRAAKESNRGVEVNYEPQD